MQADTHSAILSKSGNDTASMDVREKRDLPCIQDLSKARFLGSESKNQNSEKKNFQLFLHSPCTCKNF